MRTLSRHLLARQILFFAGGLLVLLLVGAIVEILVHLDDLVEQRARGGGVVRWLALRVPVRYAEDAVPAASFAAVFLCLGLAARARETTAIFACGVAPARVAAPLLLAAGALSVASFVFNETWLLDARREVAALASPADGPPVFWYHSGDRLYNVAGRGPDGRLRDVAVFEVGPRGRLRAATHASEARVTNEGWRLSGATRLGFGPEPGRSISLRHPRESLLAGAPALESASDAIHPSPRHDALARRLARASAVFAFALLALPLGLGVGRTSSLGGPALLGVGALLAFQGVDAAAGLAARAGLFAAGAGAWLAPAALTGVALLALGRTPR